MRQPLGRGVGGVLFLLLAACGGTVDLKTDDEGKGGSSGGSSSGAVVGGSGGSWAQPVGGGAGTGGYVPVPAGGSPGNLEPVSGPPPTEGTLAYDADRDALGRVVYLTSLGDGGCTQALTDPSVQAKQPAFSPDGTLLAYAAWVAGAYQIHVHDLESGDVQQVTDLPLGATSPAFSPDGPQITFVSGDPEVADNREPGEGNLWLANLATDEVSMLSDSESLGCCTQMYLSPVYNGPDEILVGTRIQLLGINLLTGAVRDVVPLNGRIPNPQDPSLSPDGIRYVFSDYCGSLGLHVARLDGSTGDTCQNALSINAGHELISADWGAFGFIAAEIAEPARGVMFVDDTDFSVAPFDAPGARNPAWAPADADIPIACE